MISQKGVEFTVQPRHEPVCTGWVTSVKVWSGPALPCLPRCHSLHPHPIQVDTVSEFRGGPLSASAPVASGSDQGRPLKQSQLPLLFFIMRFHQPVKGDSGSVTEAVPFRAVPRKLRPLLGLLNVVLVIIFIRSHIVNNALERLLTQGTFRFHFWPLQQTSKAEHVKTAVCEWLVLQLSQAYWAVWIRWLVSWTRGR